MESASGSLTPPSEWRELVRSGVTEGTRNDATARLAGHLLSRKIDPYVCLELVLAWNTTRNHPPLPDDEVIRTVDSIAAAELVVLVLLLEWLCLEWIFRRGTRHN